MNLYPSVSAMAVCAMRCSLVEERKTMTVLELYMELLELIDMGLGSYMVDIECLDGYMERSNTIHIYDGNEEISIVGS